MNTIFPHLLNMKHVDPLLVFALVLLAIIAYPLGYLFTILTNIATLSLSS